MHDVFSSRACRASLAIVALAALPACQREWTEVVSSDGGFRVSFPGTARANVKPAIPVVQPKEVHIWEIDRGAAGFLHANYYDLLVPFGKDGSDSPLKLDCLSPFEEGKFVAEPPRALSLDGSPGLAVAGRAPTSSTLRRGGYSEHRCYLRGQRMYHLTVVGPDSDETLRDGARFFASFAFLPR